MVRDELGLSGLVRGRERIEEDRRGGVGSGERGDD